MIYDQINSYKMLLTTYNFMIANKIIWEDNPIISNIVNKIKKAINLIEPEYLKQIKGEANKKIDYKTCRVAVTKSFITIKDASFKYASLKKDYSYINFFYINNTMINGINDDKFLNVITLAYKSILEMDSKIVPEFISNEEVLIYKKRIGAFKKALQMKNIILETNEDNNNICKNNLIAIKKVMLNELDPLILKLEGVTPEFINDYKESRARKNYNYFKREPETVLNFKITDAQNSENVNLVDIKIEKTGDKALTNENGQTYLNIEKAGVYEIIFKQPFYKNYTLKNVVCQKGKHKLINIKLRKKK